MNYYNENDKFLCEWLYQLIKDKQIEKGDIDDRSIEDVIPADLRGYTQCHFFAGLGGWPQAFKLAGWAKKKAWTGSCPCQPFSAIGKMLQFEDERHLWPAFEYLISECRPATVLGEQVSGKGAFSWVDNVQAGMEKRGYTFGVLGLSAGGHWAPHSRKRLWWVGHTYGNGLERHEFSVQALSRLLEKQNGRYYHPSISPWVHYSPASIPVCNLDGLPKPVGLIRAFGNAIVPQVGAEFIELCKTVMKI